MKCMCEMHVRMLHLYPFTSPPNATINSVKNALDYAFGPYVSASSRLFLSPVSGKAIA